MKILPIRNPDTVKVQNQNQNQNLIKKKIKLVLLYPLAANIILQVIIQMMRFFTLRNI